MARPETDVTASLPLRPLTLKAALLVWVVALYVLVVFPPVIVSPTGVMFNGLFAIVKV